MSDINLDVAVVALLVSLVALSATVMQVLQQYYASATGYSRCSNKVIGDWATTRSRRFSWKELRFEVEFDCPVIFASFSGNLDGPVPEAKIYYLDGSQKSLDETWTTSNIDLRQEYRMKSFKERIHTADNERASWFVLLFAIQRMEAKSREWQQSQYTNIRRHEMVHNSGLPDSPPSLAEAHTFTVALQRKRKTWDTMPAVATKPYATTTICHLIEIMAALGIYWKEFDRERDQYRAEGNGFTLIGGRFSDLGLMFSFHVYGKCNFDRNRVIPVDEVKELCFGQVPTIYRQTLDQRHLDSSDAEPDNIEFIRMSTASQISETLVAVGCNNKTIDYYRSVGTRTSHIFPISFEILGMLSQTFHIRHSAFTYIPNPTPDRWERKALSLNDMLECYSMLVQTELPSVSPAAVRNNVIINRIQEHIIEIQKYQSERDSVERLLLLNALHMALDDTDEILTGRIQVSRETRGHGHAQENSGQRQSESASEMQRRTIVQRVLRFHLQEVLQLLNERRVVEFDTQSLYAPGINGPSSARSPSRDRLWKQDSAFDDVDLASPEERQLKFMEIYFENVRGRVVSLATQSTSRRASYSETPSGFADFRASVRSFEKFLSTEAKSGAQATATPSLLVVDTDVKHALGNASPSLVVPDITAPSAETDQSRLANEVINEKNGKEKAPVIPLAHESVSHDDIWCTLVFRMICWLMLHDFDKTDVQISKSELLGSRLPVYIG